MPDDIPVSELTLAEKASLLVGEGYWSLNGIARLGIPPVTLSDGPNGIRHQLSDGDNLGAAWSVPAICFPTESCAACSFDTELIGQMARAIAAEALSQGVGIVLGPGVNMKRSPLAGRNFEYFSEDPVLSGKLGAAYIRGMQDAGVGCCLKHFAANNQETDRLISDSVIDDTALRELYLEPFRICVKESSPSAIMPAYNLLNGTYCCESKMLLTEVARDEWGFEGAFVSDWGAESSNHASLPAGLDVVMPGPRADYAEDVIAMAEAGKVDAYVLDRAAQRVVSMEMQHGRASSSHVGEAMPIDERYEVALRVAEESAVLLENDGLLPLDPSMTVSVIGAFSKYPRYQGAGSSRINPSRLTNLADSLLGLGMEYSYCEGYDPDTGMTTDAQLEAAARCAASSDAAIVVVGLPEGSESEGMDREHMKLPKSHVELVEAVCSVNDRVCVVIQCGAPVELGFERKPNAILLAYLGGCMGGLALAKILLGLSVPSGKLAETWPLSLSDTPCDGFFPAKGRQALYMESIFNGYRYYDAASIDVAYPFGYGLSYTSFEYSSMRIDALGAHRFEVACKVRNSGDRKGRESIQLYVSPPRDSRFLHAPKRLAGFCKVELEPGEEQEVIIMIGEEAFRHWDARSQRWAIARGDHILRIGSSSRSLPLSSAVSIDCAGELDSSQIPIEYSSICAHGFTQEGFSSLYGCDFPPIPNTRKPITQNSTIGDVRSNIVGAALLRLMIVGAKLLAKGDPKIRNLLDSLDADTPLRALSMSGVDMRIIYGAVEVLNLHLAKGLRLIKKGLGSLMQKMPQR